MNNHTIGSQAEDISITYSPFYLDVRHPNPIIKSLKQVSYMYHIARLVQYIRIYICVISQKPKFQESYMRAYDFLQEPVKINMKYIFCFCFLILYKSIYFCGLFLMKTSRISCLFRFLKKPKMAHTTRAEIPRKAYVYIRLCSRTTEVNEHIQFLFSLISRILNIFLSIIF